MSQLDDAIAEVKSRIKAVKDTAGLKKYRNVPTRPFSEDDLPAVAIMEGNDDIVKRNSRNPQGFPFKRESELIIEVVAAKEDENGDPVDIKNIYRIVRASVLQNPWLVAPTSSIEGVPAVEMRKEGPMAYGLPGILSMRLVLGIMYQDDVI